ncbi:DNA polymerase III subunit delta' C-terminal domain-containing protein [Buchnera aphidicola]|uniref:DNA polymerase III subunit delta' C-terminal domain-containing protein n=1 Tax=Buchnera aphidicola TaxID=9 RepID=UPI0034642F3B
MILYPWLIPAYKKLVFQYTNNKLHHTILVNTIKGIGIFNLIWKFSKWLLCLNKKNEENCEICYGCNLMKSLNHPDWYFLKPKKDKKTIDVETLRILNEKFFKSAQQGKIKIICFSNTEFLNEYGINVLLKILEEPPKNTFFLLINFNFFKIPLTLKSRCFLLNIYAPSEKDSLIWFKEKNFVINETHFLTSLKISENAPLMAIKLITSKLWTERINFYEKLMYFIEKKKIISLLPYLVGKNIFFKINWICLILLDAMKWKFHITESISNLDMINIIKIISSKYSYYTLDKSLRLWIKSRFYLLNILNINQELLISKKLLNWQFFLNTNKFK